jgi:hypothetical protein
MSHVNNRKEKRLRALESGTRAPISDLITEASLTNISNRVITTLLSLPYRLLLATSSVILVLLTTGFTEGG